MKKFLKRLAQREFQEYIAHWEGYHPGTWIPISQYANRCYDRYQMFWAVINFFPSEDDDFEDSED